MKTFTNLKEESYSTLVPESDIGRFYIHFRDITAINENNYINRLRAYTINNIINIINPEMKTGQVQIIDLSGKLISTYMLSGNTKQEITINSNSGFYIVNIKTDNGEIISNKVIIN